MYITLSFWLAIQLEKLVSNIRLYVQLACAGLLKCYHKTSVFNWVKLSQAFSHFPTLTLSTTQPTKYQTIHNTTTALQQHHNNTCIYHLIVFIAYTTPHDTIALNGSNNTHNNTTHANNTTTQQHTKEPTTTNTTTLQH